jgi:hypothetical protein
MSLRRENLIIALLAGAGIFYLIFIFRTSFDVNGQPFFTLVDDAMISMRYARNLAQGHGLVWNIGQPPVEGFTNPGWTLLLALIHLLPIPQPYISLVVMLIGAAILLANILVVIQITTILKPTARYAPLIAATVTAFYFPFVFWTLRGLEVGALILTLNLALLLSLRLALGPKPATVFWLSLFLGISLLIRLDAFLQVGLLLAYIFIKRPRAALLPLISSILFLTAILVFQRLYFGDFLPNTYFLKVIGVPVMERVRLGLTVLIDYASRDFLMLLFFSILAWVVHRDFRSPEMFVLLSLFFVQVLYSVWVGGDYAEDALDSANRFTAQGMTSLIILFTLTLERFHENVNASRPGPVFAFVIGIGMLVVMSGEPWEKWMINNAPMHRTDIQRVQLGLRLQSNTDPSAVIAVHAAGQIPYYSQRTTIDLLGKSDPFIAKGPPAAFFMPGHNKWNYEYSIGVLKPDVIADNFFKLHSFMESDTEYIELPNGIYVRKDSTLVDITGLLNDD